MKKFTALLLLSIMLMSIFTGCSGDSESAAVITTVADAVTETETTTLSAEESRQSVPDGIPDGLDFQGEEFNIIVATEHLYDAWIEELTGELVDDAIYERNSNTEERFNVVIPEATNTDYTQCSTYLKNSVNAGDDVYDLYLAHAVQAGADALNGYFTNWYDVNYIDFTAPWYPELAIKNLTINDKMFLSVSDMALSATENTYCMFFDKVEAANYQLPDIYELVNNGQWTIDKLITLTKDIYVDLDGNNTADENDYYGFTSNCYSNSNTYLWAFDQPVVEITPDIKVNITYNSEKTIKIIEKLRELYFGNAGSIVFEDHVKGYETFESGHAVFVNGFIGHSVSIYRDVENDFGIIPYPKWDEAQEAYYTMADGNFSIIALPVTVANTDMAGAVVHALSAYSWKNVLPLYYDVALKVKGARDEQSVELLDTILNGRVIDFAYLYDGWKGYVFTFQEFTYKNNKKEFASMYDSKFSAVSKHYDEVLELFLN